MKALERTWIYIHMEIYTHGYIYTWRYIHMDIYTHGDIYHTNTSSSPLLYTSCMKALERNMEIYTHGDIYTWIYIHSIGSSLRRRNFFYLKKPLLEKT